MISTAPVRSTYAVRGKPFPKDIAHKVIRIMDEYTRYLSPYEMANSNNGIIDMAKELGVKPKYMPHFSGHDLSWFPHPDEQKCGWLHPDGYVGITGQLSIKNPFPDETIIEWAEMLEKVLTTPEEQAAVDIVVVYTDLEENFGNKITVCDDDYKEYTIPPEEAGKYIYTQDDDFLACEVDRVAYWRSNHDVSDFFYENIKGEVKNTGYYRLNTKILQNFNKSAAQFDSDPLPVEKPTKSVALFYTLSY